MKSSLLPALWLCALALLPIEVRAQTAPALDLGLIPIGEERAVDFQGRLDLATATQAQVMAANQRVAFEIAEDSGFCLSIEAPGATTAIFLIGREAPGAPILFDVNTGPTGISSAQGRRTLARSVAPFAPTTILLEGVVGQTSSAPGDRVRVVLSTYADTTPIPQIESICGPTLRP